MSRTQRVAAGAGVAIVIAALVYLGVSSDGGAYEVLFTRLRTEDAAEIVAVLRERGVPYRLADNGTSVLVPRESVYEVRLDLAAQGIPRGGVVGFEVFQDSPIGTTDFERMVRYRQALQGELVRTIRELREVQDARVHLTLPERSPFLREQRPATASVLLHLRAPLRESQILGIAHLVARSVENLDPENVTIIDSTGRVLHDGRHFAQAGTGMDVVTRLDLQRAYERELELSVQSMLEQVFGVGRAVARVRAQMNFDLLEEREELYAPVIRDRGVLRSQQRMEESFEGMPGPADAVGVAGVEANIPGYVGMDNLGRGERVEEISNYELNRTERVWVRMPGAVESLSVAVWIDGDLGPADLQRVEDTVVSALGLDLTRGDQVTVQAFSFERPEPVAAAVAVQPSEWWEGPWIWLALLAVGVLIVFFATRRRAAPAPAAPTVDIEVDEEIDPYAELTKEARREERLRRSRQEVIERMVREKPADVVGLLRAWMLEDER